METTHPWRGIRGWKRHSLVLLVGGLIYVTYGLSLMYTEQVKSTLVALHVALSWWSMYWWGVIYIFAGLLGIISSRWPPVSETWGYAVFTGLSAGWAAFYMAAIMFTGSPLSNIRGVLTWGLLGFMWWAISGLLNPQPKNRGDLHGSRSGG
jgi:hypothetical protein